MPENPLHTDIMYIPGVGPKRAEALKKEFGINNVEELLRIYPFRYIDRSRITSIAEARPDSAYVQIQAKVCSVTLYNAQGAYTPAQGEVIKFNTIKRMSVTVKDSTGYMEIAFFRGIKWMYSRLTVGSEFIFFGKPSLFNERLQIVHPEVDNPGSTTGPGQSSMTGIYPSSEKLKNCGITGKTMNKIQQGALEKCLPYISESLPAHVLRDNGLVPLQFALQNIHFPKDTQALEQARYRLKFEELFYLQLALLKQKYIRRKGDNGIMMSKVGPQFNACYNALPFPLTGAQQRVIREIREDMRSGHQMNRLLQGDVGSGKTMVAVLCALIAIGNGYQCCIMAPTEVLAQQHFKNIQKFLAPTGVRPAILTGSSKTKERRDVHAGLEDGSIGIIVGTHALLEDKVIFHNLGLAIIDEQHRFGVEQRSRLWNKSSCGRPPHILVMTATPIPRTLAMTLFGDLDVSVIDEMPPGRKPVQTIHCTEGKRPAVYRFMRDQIALGRQIFVVYPLIYESEAMDYKNLENGIEDIVKAFPFPPYKTAIVHGQLTNEEKNFNMDAFAAGRANILVATSVIEVGVDVPNASVMVIESAERFGLSQLHQLRGRVGRGSEKSFCVLMTGYRLSKESKQRIDLMCATENGFELAEEDMKMRGPGDMEGTQQSGMPMTLNIASLAKDGLILNKAKEAAESILEEDPQLRQPKNAILRNELSRDKYNIKDYSQIS